MTRLFALAALLALATAPEASALTAPSAPVGVMLQGTPGGGPGPGGNGTNRVPVDGGLTLLALAGGAYAVRRLRDRD